MKQLTNNQITKLVLAGFKPVKKFPDEYTITVKTWLLGKLFITVGPAQITIDSYYNNVFHPVKGLKTNTTNINHICSYIPIIKQL